MSWGSLWLLVVHFIKMSSNELKDIKWLYLTLVASRNNEGRKASHRSTFASSLCYWWGGIFEWLYNLVVVNLYMMSTCISVLDVLVFELCVSCMKTWVLWCFWTFMSNLHPIEDVRTAQEDVETLWCCRTFYIPIHKIFMLVSMSPLHYF